MTTYRPSGDPRARAAPARWLPGRSAAPACPRIPVAASRASTHLPARAARAAAVPRRTVGTAAPCRRDRSSARGGSRSRRRGRVRRARIPGGSCRCRPLRRRGRSHRFPAASRRACARAPRARVRVRRRRRSREPPSRAVLRRAHPPAALLEHRAGGRYGGLPAKIRPSARCAHAPRWRRSVKTTTTRRRAMAAVTARVPEGLTSSRKSYAVRGGGGLRLHVREWGKP